MARRNIFQPPPPPTPSGEPATAESRPRFPNTGAMSGVKSTLRDLSSNAVKELDPASIDDDGPRDRLPISDADVADLAESIRLHGQQVPIMVRPLPDAPGQYRIVYGRRRLRALKLIGMPAKALVRSPHTSRRQGEMFGSTTPKRRSRKRITEVWSKTWELTNPPRLHGEMTNIGTRGPKP